MIKYFNKVRAYLIILLTVLVICGCFFINHTIKETYAEGNEYLTEEQDQKILNYYHEATVEENFESNKINVILKSEYKKLGKIGFSDFEVVDKVVTISSLSHNLDEMRRGEGKALPLLEQENQIITLKLETQDKQKVLEAIKLLNTLDIVLIAEPSYIYDSVECWAPNDSKYGFQWGLHGPNGINAQAAWEFTRGNTDIKVGVMEGGIDLMHEDLQGRVYNGNVVPSADADLAHGTHVAGIIGAKKNDYGIAGIADVTMYLLNWNSDEFVNSLTFATQNNIKLINASFRYLNIDETNAPFNSAHYTALKNYIGLMICCAHNQNSNLDVEPLYPACYDLPNVISVGSITSKGEKASSSNYGEETVDIYAPGDNILSTFPSKLCRAGACSGAGNGTHFVDGYHYMSGTSMATPHVTGVAALLLSHDPTLTASQLKEAILNGADNIKISVPEGTQNVKKLNALGAIESCEIIQMLASGKGSAAKPFLIRSEIQLRNIELTATTISTGGKRILGTFKLISSISLTKEWTPISTLFAGVFDGDGYTISNMRINVNSTNVSKEYFGLFRAIENGTVKDLRLLYCNINTESISTETPTEFGIVAGYSYKSVLKNVEVSNSTITCNVENALVGGFFGHLYGGQIENCEVKNSSEKDPNDNSVNKYRFETNGFCLGGMVGLLSSYGKITDSKCTTQVIMNDYTDSKHVGKIYGYTSDDRTYVTDCEENVEVVKNEKTCIAAGTLITLADGRQVPVETLTGDEMLLVWNLHTGSFDTAPILFIDSDPWKPYKVIDLSFSDGTSVKVIYEHGFWDYNLNEYVYLRDDAAQYTGHWFNKQAVDENGNFISQRVQLTDVTVQEEYTAAYSPVTYGHLCYYVNGMLSMPGGIEGLFNTFEVDPETMSYDAASMQADIEQYGLFTYEEFAELVPVTEEAFEAFNGQYLKVAIGKGLVDIQTLNSLAEHYAKYLS